MDSAASITIYPMVLQLYTGQLGLQDQMANDKKSQLVDLMILPQVKRAIQKSWQLTTL